VEDQVRGEHAQEHDRDPEMDVTSTVSVKTPEGDESTRPRRQHVAGEDAGRGQKDKGNECDGINQ
jgi:hypothetical protein